MCIPYIRTDTSFDVCLLQSLWNSEMLNRSFKFFNGQIQQLYKMSTKIDILSYTDTSRCLFTWARVLRHLILPGSSRIRRVFSKWIYWRRTAFPEITEDSSLNLLFIIGFKQHMDLLEWAYMDCSSCLFLSGPYH